jgi:hypothetical protein
LTQSAFFDIHLYHALISPFFIFINWYS